MKLGKKIFDFYYSRKKSERILLLATCYVALLCWAIWLKGKNSKLNENLFSMQGKFSQMQTVLGFKEQILSDMKNAKNSVDSQKTVDGKTLQIVTESCAVSAGLSYDISDVSTSQLGGFKIFTLTLNIPRCGMQGIVDFEKSILAHSPYVFINSATISSTARGAISAKYQISSFVVE